MIELAQKSLCSGCAACAAVCSRNAITMQPDAEGFLSPQIDCAKCVECGLCQKVCPVLVRNTPRIPLSVYAACALDDGVRLQSSSGGVFTLLARQVIENGGIVFGAAIRKSDLMVAHQSAETEEELAALRGSKYVQSDVGDTYRQAKQQLDVGRQVLYSGTPCQIAALRRVLGRDYPNCLCVEVICHAAPSPLAWQRYLAERKAKARRRTGAPECGINPRRISFRRKDFGWKRYSLSMRFMDDTEHLADRFSDPFLRGFSAELFNRSSCHQCAVRELRSGADLTIADYWNVHEKFPGMDDDKGTSVILVNTEKGMSAWTGIRASCRFEASDYGDIKRTNPAVFRSAPPHRNRHRFFELVRRESSFDAVVDKLLRRPLWRRICSWCKRQIRGVFS